MTEKKKGKGSKEKREAGSKRKKGRTVESPFIIHEGRTFVIMNWHEGLDAGGILLIRPLTKKEREFFERMRRDSDAEIHATLFPTDAEIWSPKS